MEKLNEPTICLALPAGQLLTHFERVQLLVVKNVSMRRKRIFIMIILIILSTACGSENLPPVSVQIESASPTHTLPSNTPVPSQTISPTPSQTNTPSHTASPTPIQAITPSPTSSATSTRSDGKLRGQVIPEKLSCRFGPGVPYLYKYGILATTNIEILGRMERSSWVLVQAIGGNNACWVNGNYLTIEGEPLSLPPVDPHIVLAWSPYYSQLTGANAVRFEDLVTLSWHSLNLNAGDDSEQFPYVVEAWLCEDGEFRFAAIGTYDPEITLIDEVGCAEISFTRVSGAEKHGYTVWTDIACPNIKKIFS